MQGSCGLNATELRAAARGVEVAGFAPAANINGALPMEKPGQTARTGDRSSFQVTDEQRREFLGRAGDAVKFVNGMKQGEHRMPSIEMSDNAGLVRSVEYTAIAASAGVLHSLMGDNAEADRLLDVIANEDIVKRDGNGQVTIGPENAQESTLASLWTSILARSRGRIAFAEQQGFREDLHMQSNVRPGGQLAGSGLYVRKGSPVDCPQTYMNALIGFAYAQKGEYETARRLLESMSDLIPRYSNGLYHISAEMDTFKKYGRGNADVALMTALHAILALGAEHAEAEWGAVVKLEFNNTLRFEGTQTRILAGIMFAMVAGRVL